MHSSNRLYTGIIFPLPPPKSQWSTFIITQYLPTPVLWYELQFQQEFTEEQFLQDCKKHSIPFKSFSYFSSHNQEMVYCFFVCLPFPAYNLKLCKSLDCIFLNNILSDLDVWSVSYYLQCQVFFCLQTRSHSPTSKASIFLIYWPCTGGSVSEFELCADFNFFCNISINSFHLLKVLDWFNWSIMHFYWCICSWSPLSSCFEVIRFMPLLLVFNQESDNLVFQIYLLSLSLCSLSFFIFIIFQLY